MFLLVSFRDANVIDMYLCYALVMYLYRDTYGPRMNTLPKDFPWMSHISTVLLIPPRAQATIVEDTPYRIPHTKHVKFPCFL